MSLLLMVVMMMTMTKFGLLSVTGKIPRPLQYLPTSSVRYLSLFHYRTLWHMSQPTNVSPWVVYWCVDDSLARTRYIDQRSPGVVIL